MKPGMNLKNRNGVYHIWFSRSEVPPKGRLLSLKTSDKAEAEAVLRAYKQKWVEDRLIDLQDRGKNIPLMSFHAEYEKSRPDLSPETRRLDHVAFSRLSDAIGNKALYMISTRDFDKFKATCAARELSPFSINTYLRHLRAGFNMAVEWGYLEKPIKIKSVKTPHRSPRPLSKQQIADILDAAASCRYDMWRIIVFALWTGCRRNEIIGARYQDIKDGRIRIIGKGDRERVVPLSPSEDLAEAIGTGQHIGPIFRQYHQTTVSHLFRDICDAVGIPAEYHFHNLRHSSATFMLSSGIPLEVVQKILGHSSIRTTQIYADVLAEIQDREIKKLSFE